MDAGSVEVVEKKRVGCAHWCWGILREGVGGVHGDLCLVYQKVKIGQYVNKRFGCKRLEGKKFSVGLSFVRGF